MKMKQALGRSTNRLLKHPHTARPPQMNAPFSTLLALRCSLSIFSLYFLVSSLLG